MVLDVFQTINKIYTSKNLLFINDIDEEVNYISPIVLNLFLSRNTDAKHQHQVMSKLNKYIYVLTPKQYAALAWGLIQPKYLKAPFVKKPEEFEEEKSRYDFLLEKVRARLEIGNNDWTFCKDYFLQDIKDNTIDYLVFYGCKKREWSQLGLDFEDSKKINVTEVVEGLDKYF